MQYHTCPVLVRGSYLGWGQLFQTVLLGAVLGLSGMAVSSVWYIILCIIIYSLSCVVQVNSHLNSCGFFLFPPTLEREGREQESSGVVVSFWLSLNDDT